MERVSDIKNISILGCGWYGFALAKQLRKVGYQVSGSTTSDEKLEKLRSEGIKPSIVNFDSNSEVFDADFFNCDILIISIPPKRKSGEASTYPDKITRIKEIAVKSSVKNILFISSTGVYGDYNAEVTEDTQPQPDTESGKAILSSEDILINSGISTTILRFGGLIGPGRNPARFFSGKQNIPNGKAPVNLIHLNDCLEISLAIIEKKAFGYVFNACCNQHPAKMDFYHKAAIESGLEPPQFVGELINWKIVSSKYLQPLLGISISSFNNNFS